jgi:hypothetical protein
MNVSKRIGVFIVVTILMFIPMIQAAMVNDITPSSVSPDLEPGWRGKVTVKFSGTFLVDATSFSSSVEDALVQISNISVVSSTPNSTGFDVTMEMIVETGLKLRTGKVGFTISDGGGNRVKGNFRVKNFSGQFTDSKPHSINGGNSVEVLLKANKNFPGGSSLMNRLVQPPPCSITAADLLPPDTIKAIVDVPESVAGKNLSFFFQLGDADQYQTFVGMNLIPVTYDYVRVFEVNPPSGIQGQKNLLLQLKGKNFSNDTKVKFSEQDIDVGTPKYHSQTVLEVPISIPLKTKPGKVNVMVSDKGLQNVGVGLFEVIELEKPIISKIEPNKIHYQPDSFFLTISGQGFNKDTVFSISGKGIKILNQTIVGPGEARLEILVARNADEGSRSISAVKMEELKFNRPNALFVEILRPSVDSMNPSYAEQGTKDNEISVSGMNFDREMKIKFSSNGITLKTLEIQSDKSFRMVIDIAEDTVAGNEVFYLTNPEQNSIAVPDKFKIIKKQYDYKISLVAPGTNCLDIKEGPASGLGGAANLKIPMLYPVFKWLSNAKSYNFGLYTAIEGQKEIAEIISNRPVYAMEGLTTDNLTYPLKARELRPGKRYYWKVEAIFKDKTIQSEVWCFEVEDTSVR